MGNGVSVSIKNGIFLAGEYEKIKGEGKIKEDDEIHKALLLYYAQLLDEDAKKAPLPTQPPTAVTSREQQRKPTALKKALPVPIAPIITTAPPPTTTNRKIVSGKIPSRRRSFEQTEQQPNAPKAILAVSQSTGILPNVAASAPVVVVAADAAVTEAAADRCVEKTTTGTLSSKCLSARCAKWLLKALQCWIVMSNIAICTQKVLKR